MAMAELAAQSVRKRFGGLVALDDVSLEVEPGKIVGLIGPNGAGKTTLFNALTGFDTIDSGSIVFGESRIDGLAPWRIARLGVGRTFQTPVGFPELTVWENLVLGAAELRSDSLLAALAGRRYWGAEESEHLAQARSMLKQMDLWSHRRAKLKEIPIGDAKLVELGRQLMAKPKALLLDEPAAGVDPSGVETLHQALRSINEAGITLVIIEHNLSFLLELADVVHVLARGKVIFSGAPGDVAKDPLVQETYLGKDKSVA